MMEKDRTTGLDGQERPDIIVEQDETLSYAKKWLFGSEDGELVPSGQDPEEGQEPAPEKEEESAPDEEQQEESSHKPFGERNDTGVKSGEQSPGLERVRDGQRVYLSQDGQVSDDPLLEQQDTEPEEEEEPVPEDNKDAEDKAKKEQIKKRDHAAYERQQQYIREADEKQRQYDGQYRERQDQYIRDGQAQSGQASAVVRYENGIPLVEDAEAAVPPVYPRQPFRPGTYPAPVRDTAGDNAGMPGVDSGEGPSFYEERVREREQDTYRIPRHDEQPAGTIGEEAAEEGNAYITGKSPVRRKPGRKPRRTEDYYNTGSPYGSPASGNTGYGSPSSGSSISGSSASGYSRFGFSASGNAGYGSPSSGSPGSGNTGYGRPDYGSEKTAGENGFYHDYYRSAGEGHNTVSADITAGADSGIVSSGGERSGKEPYHAQEKGTAAPSLRTGRGAEKEQGQDIVRTGEPGGARNAVGGKKGGLPAHYPGTIAGYKRSGKGSAAGPAASEGAGKSVAGSGGLSGTGTQFAARRKPAAGPGPDPGSVLNISYGTGAVSAVMSSKKNDDEDNENGISDAGLSAAKSFPAEGITAVTDKLKGGNAPVPSATDSGGEAAHVPGYVRASRDKDGTLLRERSRNGVVRLKAAVHSKDPDAGRESKVRTGRPSRFASRDDANVSTGRSFPARGEGNVQGTVSGHPQAVKLPSSAPQGQSSTARGAGSLIKGKVKAVFKAVARRLAAGTVAATVATGAVAGGSVMMGMRSGSDSDAKWAPLQAHVSADGTDYGKALTQETLESLHERMRAYGIQTAYAESSTATGAVTIHMPGYSDDFNGYNGGDGDSTIMFIGKECFLIDGGCGTLSDMTQDYLQKRGVTEITAMISHWHGDHYIALEKILEKGEIKIKTLYCPPPEEIRKWDSGDAWAGDWIIEKVKERGGIVIIPEPEKTIPYSISGLNMTVWRRTPLASDARYGLWDIPNDSSLQVYFPDLYYYTNGDMSFHMSEFLDVIQGQPIRFFKCGHHGNGSKESVPRLKDEFGAQACWYNDAGPRGELGGGFVVAANKAAQLGMKVFQAIGDIDINISGGTARVTGKDGTFSYTCPYTGGGGSTVTDDVAAYALSWVGENGKILVPYKSSVTGNDPNEERFQDLAVGRGSDCSWFVYHVLMDCGVLADDTEFIHSYEWGSNPELYPNGHDVGTDLSNAKPGDVLCYAYNYPRKSGNSHVGIYIGNGEMVECAAGAGGVVKSEASDWKLISIVHFDTKAGTASATLSPYIDLSAQETTSRYDFTPETEAIVEAHMHDFTYDNFDSFMAAHGGAENYVRSLGGVFAKWVGRDAYVQTAGEFQEIAEYVMGIYTIWGPDYKGGGGEHKFNGNWGDGDQDGRFYSGEVWRWWREVPMEDVFFHDREHIITDCGCGIYHLMQKAGLRDHYGGTTYSDTAEREVDHSLGGKVIYRKEDLQVGDLIQMSHSRDETGWGHVCVVGEIHSDGKIIAYDTGNRYVNTGSYKKELIFNDDGSLGGVYDGYNHWFGERMREISQTGGVSSGGAAATQDLGDIRINSVTVDGDWRNRNDFSFNTLGSYEENGRRTTSVTKKFRFVDGDGNEISPTGLTSLGAVTAGGAGTDRTVGAGTVIEIPDGLGDIYTYMGWQTVTSPESNQYRLREQAGQNFDEEGFGRINGRYVIACTATYGNVGDYIDFVKEDGLVFHCVIGDIKSRKDRGCNEWGHKNGRNVIEFVVDKDSWYPCGHANPGTSSFHPEWASDTVRAVNVGSYFTDPSSGGNPSGLSMQSSDTEKAMYLAMQVLSMSVIGSRYDNPSKKEAYQDYCFDVLDYAVCESGGADVRYTSSGDGSMTCSVEVTVHCDLAELEKNDRNFFSWGYDHPSGDPDPASYMSLPIKTFNQIFNVDTFAGSSAVNPFTGNEEIVYEFFAGKGLGPAQIAGIMANIRAESNFNPKAVNSSSGAKGLFQWLGGRAAGLDSYAGSRKKEWTDLNCQLEYAWTEIDDDIGWNGNAAQRKGFMSTDSAKEAAIIFCTYWERAGSGIAAKRGEYAEDYYSTIMNARTMGLGGSTSYLQWAVAIANDDSHGYSQASRNGNPDYDCSSFVFYALKNSGYDVGDHAFTTYTMTSILQRLGFRKIAVSSEAEMQPGDILWRETHTELYLGNGKSVGAHSARGHYEAGDQDGTELSVAGLAEWHWVFRR